MGVETTDEHNGYLHSVGRTLTIVILGSLCGLCSVQRIHQWASTPRIREFLKEHFGIYTISTYCWMLKLLKIIKPESLNQRFTSWATTLLPEVIKDLTISFDGKSIRSTGKMSEYEKPLHILSAYLAEAGLTIGQKTVSKKSNEIPAMRELLELIDIQGCMIVADALHCQTKTAQAILNNGGDYLLNVKDNQETLKKDIEDFVQDSKLRAEMEETSSCEKNGGRIELRQAFVSHQINCMEEHLEKWAGLECFGAINRQFINSDGKSSDEWHYYISSRQLTPEELLKYARNEWTIESMHWMLDVHFNEDFCRVRDSNVQQNLNMIRKAALNCIRIYKNESKSKVPFSGLMFGCLLDCDDILKILDSKSL